jgi:hypothetical protein
MDETGKTVYDAPFANGQGFFLNTSIAQNRTLPATQSAPSNRELM